jgi:beta-phosphoglucomutase
MATSTVFRPALAGGPVSGLDTRREADFIDRMGPRRFQAAIFDFDGVIADSIPLHYEAFRRVFAAQGVTFSFEDYRRVANGAPRDMVIRTVLGQMDSGRLKWLMAEKEREVMALLGERGLQPIPGALELARDLRSRGLRTAVASSSRTARRFLEALEPRDPSCRPPLSLFDAVLESDGIRAPKPDPEIFLSAAQAVGTRPEDCLAFEDAVQGVRAARAAGMLVVALTTTEERGALGEAHLIFDSFGEIDPDGLLEVGGWKSEVGS